MRAPPSSPARSTPPAGSVPALPPPLSPRHPAAVLATLVAAACVLLSVSFVLYETDLWQHLRVGQAIWESHSVPTRQVWIWPTWGVPDVTPSWGFRALVWPFWALGDVRGLFAWRWLAALAAFGILWVTARRMGARGLGGLIVVVLAALVYRQRSQIRPEALAAVLLALAFWILETRRRGGPDRALWLVPLAWAWANIHISYLLGPALLGLYTIGELRPVLWAVIWTNGLPLLVFGWPALILWRWRAIPSCRARRLGPDRPGLALGVGRAWQAIGDRDRARIAFRREMDRFPGLPEARAAREALDSLAAGRP